uniref:protein diaphanous homolog 1-like isoform X1 n=1 Tax=Scatophagus argus TaxID=75038 RepID=UPI001ED83D0C|nr:protein diaphanous homolog 1-like isoform X1 [Scatophagus argus]
MNSSESELKKISTELKHLSLKRQQLVEKKNLLGILQELRNRAEFGHAEDKSSNQHEIDSIDDKLKQLTERKAELQKSHDNILNAKDKKSKIGELKFTEANIHSIIRWVCNHLSSSSLKVSFTPSQTTVPATSPPPPPPVSGIIYVEAPPTIPAPTVILDLEKLPECPCRTQCPECRQFIMTETYTSVSSVTWLVCFMTALIGCVAGCCLIPFCLDRFKSTTHRCPKCRTSIQTIKKL